MDRGAGGESAGTRRIALITGAAGGIGQAAVSAFLEAGWDVAAVDRRPIGGVSNATRQYRIDVSRTDEVRRLFQEVTRDFGRLDALVNNAAVPLGKPLLETSAEEWDEVMASNLRSAFLTARHGHALLRDTRGSIVHVSSVHAVATSLHVAAYAASKGGLVALTRAMAIELAPDQIRVNAVLPGAVDTPMLHEGMKRGGGPPGTAAERLSDLERRTPLGRVGRPHEIAQAILFLADADWSSFVTGQVLIVDGGATARLSTE